MPLLGKSDITSMERRSPSPKNDKQRSGPSVAAGIEWTPRQIYDIFEFVSQVAETAEIEVPQVEDGTENESSEVTVWFSPDPGVKVVFAIVRCRLRKIDGWMGTIWMRSQSHSKLNGVCGCRSKKLSKTNMNLFKIQKP